MMDGRRSQGAETTTSLGKFAWRGVLGVVALLMWVVVLAAPPPGAARGITSGGSILYIKNNNVWVSAPDGSGPRQLTTVGTASRPLSDPTTSDDGKVIVAVQNRKDANGFPQGWIYEFDHSGKQLRAFHPSQYATQLGGSCTVKVIQAPRGVLAAVSPDGKHIAINPIALNYSFDCGGLAISYVYVVNLNGAVTTSQIKPPGNDATLAYEEPAWVGNNRLLLYQDIGNQVDTYVIGKSTASHWIAPADLFDNGYQYPSLRSDRLATTGSDSSGNPAIRLWTVNGGPPAMPTARCEIPDPDPSKYDYFNFEFAVPRIAPDGKALVWEEVDETGSSPVTRVYVSPMGNIASGCGSLHRQLLVGGASDPFWSPARFSSK